MRIILEGSRIKTIEDFHREIKNVLELPDYYGNNLDALWDCLTGWIETPLTLIWKDFGISKTNLGSLSEKVVSVLIKAEKEVTGFKVEYP